MKQCCWCKRKFNIHTKTWEVGAAEMIQEASGSICPDCKKKITEEYQKNRGRIESGNRKIA
jgi:DNA-directed RNA polymerase subunit RPC12/RpoP